MKAHSKRYAAGQAIFGRGLGPDHAKFVAKAREEQRAAAAVNAARRAEIAEKATGYMKLDEDKPLCAT